MVCQCIASIRDLAVAIQVLVHDITSSPLVAKLALSTIWQGSQMLVHLIISLGNSDGFITPDFAYLAVLDIARQGTGRVVWITGYLSLSI
ncbi:Uncharacterised protein [Segatella copri]|nr:Uncharacterised protein [Segatella copri]